MDSIEMALVNAFRGAPLDRTLYVALDLSSMAGSLDVERVWLPAITSVLSRIEQPQRLYVMGFCWQVGSAAAYEPPFFGMMRFLPLFVSGGTSYDAALDAARADRTLTGEDGPHRLVILGDGLGYTSRPPSPQEFDVVWAMTHGGVTMPNSRMRKPIPPFGRVVRLPLLQAA